MPISELIAVLEKYKNAIGNVNVLVTWESRISTLSPENVYVAGWGDLILDADDNFYKLELQTLTKSKLVG